MKVSIWFNKRKAELAGVLTILLIWQWASIKSGNILLPSPLETIYKMKNVISSPNFITAVSYTTLRGLAGFFISAIFGVGLGYSAGKVNVMEKFYQPGLNFIKATPVMSIIILLLIWFETTMIPVVVSFLVGFPIIYSNVLQGTKAIDQKLVEMAEVYGLSHKTIFIHVYIPAIAPYIFAGLNTTMGIGWKAVIAAEVLLQPKYSIGMGLISAKQYLDFGMVFSWTLVAIILSYFFERTLRGIECYLIRWKEC